MLSILLCFTYAQLVQREASIHYYRQCDFGFGTCRLSSTLQLYATLLYVCR